MKTALFLQCRLDSTRLPRKALKMISGKSMVEHAMTALKQVPVEEHILLTTEDSVDGLSPLAKQCGFKVFSGPKQDVLKRFILAADKYFVSTILRGTADNPLVSADLAESLLQEHREQKAHYSGYLGIPLGTGVEILETSALKTAQAESRDPYDHEHVAPYLYRNPDKFRVYRPDLSDQWGDPGIKVSVDTQEDYERILLIFEQLYRGKPVEIQPLVHYLRNHILND